MKMDGFEGILEYSIAKRFENLLGDGFEVVQEYTAKNKRRQDIAILVDHKPVAFIECKLNARLFVEAGDYKRWLLSFSKPRETKYLFVSDEHTCFFCQDDSFSEVSFEEAVAIICEDIAKAGRKPLSRSIKKRLLEVVEDDAAASSILNTLSPDDIEFDNKEPRFYLPQNVEDELFLCKLKRVEGKELCRYTTIDNLFELLKKEKQNMCNIVCMNDRGEYRYADTFVFEKSPKVGETGFNELDSCFVLSLLEGTQEDNLTMWRLYGDDAKGACLIYDVDDAMKKGIKEQFFLAKVSYGREDGTHPELAFFKKLVESVRVRKWSLYLRRWNIWKHFFKSHHFSIENEVRLMYYDSPVKRGKKEDYKWIKNSESQIVTKMQLFDFGGFPLKIKASLIGPKCEEHDLLARQFYLMADSTTDCKISVSSSDLKDYR